MGRSSQAALPTSNSAPAPTAFAPAPLYLATGLPLAQTIAVAICFSWLRCRETLYTALRVEFKFARAPCDPGVLRCRCLRSAPISECQSAELSGPGPVYRPGALP
ncbi:hypothetical protein NDU88_001116 [Pleurodeles waltl]|uniref:Uncharacterized protein n=1 Tax=Pleurodeles waltl TaxID=8319 RepID=A0AAV7SYB0_PLEWA|nr:hypothetical protein NDU88_001116 [Pleurodeles waltl]